MGRLSLILGTLFLRLLAWLVVFGIFLVLGACSSASENFDHAATDLGLRRDLYVGTEFQNILYWRDGSTNRTLHVYLGGDGTPEKAGRPAKDPTPRNPLMLRLLSRDPGPAVYIGRPCYHGLADEAGCASELWTSARYSEEVVAGMASTLSDIMTARDYNRISFFGHSGGGTLAMLLAERFPGTIAVVTIAPNLDIDAWADHHGYTRLTASLNPAERPALPGSILQRHYIGSRDRIVPMTLVRDGIKGANAELIVVDGYDHVCCWSELWPEILADLPAIE